jgi:biotin transport system substrate-specific component
MILDQSIVPTILDKSGNKVSHNVIATLIGTAIIALVAQISIPLPFTPVPITGQTFGVALISLLWGQKRGLASVGLYLSLGFCGLPVFALGKSGLNIGPTSGYLIGMMVAAYLMGTLADRGWTKTFWRTWAAAFCGSLVTFLCGVLVLSLYIPKDSLLVAGVLPFIPGDVIKTLLAVVIVRQVASRTESST